MQYSVNLGLFSLNLVLQIVHTMYIYTFGQNISKTSHTCTCTCTWSTIHVQIIDGHGWLAIVTGVATDNCMHRPEGMIQMKSMSRRCKVCSLFFACIIWYFPKYFLLLCRVSVNTTGSIRSQRLNSGCVQCGWIHLEYQTKLYMDPTKGLFWYVRKQQSLPGTIKNKNKYVLLCEVSNNTSGISIRDKMILRKNTL